MLETSQVCPLRTCFCTIQGILHIKESHSSCQRRCFSFSIWHIFKMARELLSEWLWSVSLCTFPAPAIRPEWLWLGGVLIDVCTYVWGACIPSQGGTCAHVGWGWKEKKKNSVPFVLVKAKLVMNTLFHVSCERVAREQALGFNKAQQLLVCFGGAEWGGEKAAAQGRSWDLQRAEEGHLLSGTSSCGECATSGALIKPGNDSLWNTIRTCKLPQEVLM